MSEFKEQHNWRTGEMRKLGWKERQREQTLIDFYGRAFGPAEASDLMRNEASQIQNSLEAIVGKINKKLNNPARIIEQEWDQYVEEPILSKARPKFLRQDGTLIIEADNATLMYAMRNYYSRELLMRFKQRFPDQVKNLLIVTATKDKKS